MWTSGPFEQETDCLKIKARKGMQGACVRCVHDWHFPAISDYQRDICLALQMLSNLAITSIYP